MAGSFTVVSQTPDVQVLSPTQVLDVERVGFVTHPTGIYAEVPVFRQAWLQESQEANLAAYADAIEGLIANGLATDGSYANDLDANGLLVDYIDFVVTYVPPNPLIPPMTATVRIPLGTLGASGDPWFGQLPGSPDSLIGAAWQRLQETANL